MKSEIKAWRAAKRLKVSLKFLMKLRVAGVLDGWRYDCRGDWYFDRSQVERLLVALGGEYGTEEMAFVLQMSERTVRRMVGSGTLPDRRFVTADGRRLGKLRFQRVDLEEALKRRENGCKTHLSGEMLSRGREEESVPSHRM